MKQTLNSDEKMVTSKIFDHILQQIQQSNLNFCIQVSPFSASISLKKSLAKDKMGLPVIQYLSSASPFSKYFQLLCQIQSLS